MMFSQKNDLSFIDVFPTEADFLKAYDNYPLTVFDRIPDASLNHIWYHLFLNHGNEIFKYRDIRRCEFSLIDFLNHNYPIYRKREEQQATLVKSTQEELSVSGFSTSASLQNQDNDDVSAEGKDMSFVSKKTLNSGGKSVANTAVETTRALRMGLSKDFYDALVNECFVSRYWGRAHNIYVGD